MWLLSFFPVRRRADGVWAWIVPDCSSLARTLLHTCSQHPPHAHARHAGAIGPLLAHIHSSQNHGHLPIDLALHALVHVHSHPASAGKRQRIERRCSHSLCMRDQPSDCKYPWPSYTMATLTSSLCRLKLPGSLLPSFLTCSSTGATGPHPHSRARGRRRNKRCSHREAASWQWPSPVV